MIYTANARALTHLNTHSVARVYGANTDHIANGSCFHSNHFVTTQKIFNNYWCTPYVSLVRFSLMLRSHTHTLAPRFVGARWCEARETEKCKNFGIRAWLVRRLLRILSQHSDVFYFFFAVVVVAVFFPATPVAFWAESRIREHKYHRALARACVRVCVRCCRCLAIHTRMAKCVRRRRTASYIR